MSPEKKESFNAAVEPLIKWLCENAHPHMKIIVTTTGAELTEGVTTTGFVDKYLQD